jgi:hypothetical protein
VEIRPYAAFSRLPELGVVELSQGALDKEHTYEDYAEVLVEVGEVLVWISMVGRAK